MLRDGGRPCRQGDGFGWLTGSCGVWHRPPRDALPRGHGHVGCCGATITFHITCRPTKHAQLIHPKHVQGAREPGPRPFPAPPCLVLRPSTSCMFGTLLLLILLLTKGVLKVKILCCPHSVPYLQVADALGRGHESIVAAPASSVERWGLGQSTGGGQGREGWTSDAAPAKGQTASHANSRRSAVPFHRPAGRAGAVHRARG